MLKTPQLGVTQRSPKSAIENERNSFWWSRRPAEQITKPHGVSILIDQEKVRRLLPNARGASRSRDLIQDIEDYVTKKCETKQSNRCDNRPKNLSPINLRPAESTEETDYQQRKANSKQQKVCPGKIARDWKPGEEIIGEQPGDRDNEARPDRPIPFSFHVDLSAVRTNSSGSEPMPFAKPSDRARM